MISKTNYRAWTESIGGSTSSDRSSIAVLNLQDFRAGEASGTVPG
jgi:hypothetical protein